MYFWYTYFWNAYFTMLRESLIRVYIHTDQLFCNPIIHPRTSILQIRQTSLLIELNITVLASRTILGTYSTTCIHISHSLQTATALIVHITTWFPMFWYLLLWTLVKQTASCYSPSSPLPCVISNPFFNYFKFLDFGKFDKFRHFVNDIKVYKFSFLK